MNPTLYLALTAMLTRDRTPITTSVETTDDGLYDESRCRTEGCEQDPNDGEGWAGFCGNCADLRFTAGIDNDDD